MTTLPDRMTVIAIRKPGGPEVLNAEPRPVPKAGAGEILIKVAAARVNRPDVMQRMGLYPPPPGATFPASKLPAKSSRVERARRGGRLATA
jgi:NADPH2:quinone reductase